MEVIFFKIKAKNVGEPVGPARLFNAEIWKMNNILLFQDTNNSI